MDQLKHLVVFAETVIAGSMSVAARRLGMTPSAVSQMISALENQNGVKLMHRSTRKLTLTDAGEVFFPHCQRVLESAKEAAASLEFARLAPTGELRMSAPVGFATHISLALAKLLADAPQLALYLVVDDARIDLIDARIDIAIRAGDLADSDWVARHLCDIEMILCASPIYLARCGTPTNPYELSSHQWLSQTEDNKYKETGNRNSKVRHGTIVELRANDCGPIQIEVKPRIAINNQDSIRQICEHGFGIACLAKIDVLSALQSRKLVQILPSWNLHQLPVWAVSPKQGREAVKIRLAIDYLKRYFAMLPASINIKP